METDKSSEIHFQKTDEKVDIFYLRCSKHSNWTPSRVEFIKSPDEPMNKYYFSGEYSATETAKAILDRLGTESKDMRDGIVALFLNFNVEGWRECDTFMLITNRLALGGKSLSDIFDSKVKAHLNA